MAVGWAPGPTDLPAFHLGTGNFWPGGFKNPRPHLPHVAGDGGDCSWLHRGGPHGCQVGNPRSQASWPSESSETWTRGARGGYQHSPCFLSRFPEQHLTLPAACGRCSISLGFWPAVVLHNSSSHLRGVG